MRAIELDAKLAGELKGDAVTVNATALSGYVLTEAHRAELIEMKRAATERNQTRWPPEQPRAAALANAA